MIQALKIIFLFERPTWNDYRFPYIFLGIIAWLELIGLISNF